MRKTFAVFSDSPKTEKIVLELLSDEFLQGHVRSVLKSRAGVRLSENDVNYISQLLVLDRDADIEQIDILRSRLSPDEQYTLMLEIYQIDENEVILYYLRKHKLTAKEQELLEQYLEVAYGDK